MPLIVSKQVVNMVEIRIELPKLKILTSMVISEDPPISTQSTFDFPYFPLLSPFFFFCFFLWRISPWLFPAPPGQRSSSELAVQEAILMSLMSPADTVPMALGFNPTDDGDEIEGNLWKSTYGLWIYIYYYYYFIYIHMWKSRYFTGIYKPRSGGHHGKHLELRIEKQ